MVKQYFIEYLLHGTFNSLATQSPVWIISHRYLPKKQTVSNKISLIIVNWNTKKYTASCLKSIYQNCSLKNEIIAIDNNSTDDSVLYLKRHFLKIRLVQNKKNYGYAKANNQGVRLAKNEFVVILNPDTQIKKNTLEELVKFYKTHPSVGAVVPKLLNPDGSIQYYYHSKLPSLKNQVASFIYNYTSFKKFRWSQELFLLDQKFENDTKIEQAAGVCILTTKSVIKKIGGLFDEKLPIFLNDVDFSYRLKKHNLDIFLVASSHLVHHRSSSTDKLDPYTLRQEAILSTLHYFRKNNGFLSYLVVKTLLLFFMLSILVLTFLGLIKSYLMAPIIDKKTSIELQWQNIKAASCEKRSHPGLIAG